VALGLVFITAGLFILLFAVGVVPGAEQSLEAPRWVGVCAGLVFALCGVALIIGFAVAGGAAPDGDLPAGTPFGLRLTQYLIGLAISGSMAAIFSWVAFGPGPRHFSVTVSFAGRSAASETMGRIAFGIGATLMYVFVAVLGVVGLRRLRNRK